MLTDIQSIKKVWVTPTFELVDVRETMSGVQSSPTENMFQLPNGGFIPVPPGVAGPGGSFVLVPK